MRNLVLSIVGFSALLLLFTYTTAYGQEKTQTTQNSNTSYYIVLKTSDLDAVKKLLTSGGTSGLVDNSPPLTTDKVDKLLQDLASAEAGGTSGLGKGVNGSSEIRGCLSFFGAKICTANIGGPKWDVTLGIANLNQTSGGTSGILNN